MQGYGLAATIQPLVVCPTSSHATAEHGGFGNRGAQTGRSGPDFPASCSACGAARLLSSAGGANASSFRRSSLFGRGLSLTASTRLENARGVSRSGEAMPRAAIAVEAPVDEIAGEYQLEGGTGHLKIKTSGATPGSPACVELEVFNCNVSSLVLHWGAIKSGKGKWYLPGQRPADSWDFHNQAVQSRFVKDGDRAVLKVEFEDAAYTAIEFLLKEDNSDRWFKNNGGNFRVEIPRPSINVTIPDDLVGVQSYIRWERNGKQQYSPEQEKENFEAARKELELEIASGLSIDDLRSKLTGGSNGGTTDSSSGGKSEGKPAKKSTFGLSKVSRKKRDPLELLNSADEVATGAAQTGTPAPPREPTPLELAAQVFQEAEEGFTIFRKIVKLGPSDLLVLVTNPDGVLKVRLATNLEQGPLTLHWAVSKNNAKEWLAPAEKYVPQGSVLTEGFAQTPFKDGFAGNASLKSLELNFGDSDYFGMPFLVKVGEDWWKDNGGDYYVTLKPKDTKQPKALGSGTAKAFLEDVADQESEAERSLMHRCECHDLFDEMVPYVTSWAWQKETVDSMCAAVTKGEEPSSSVMILQHPPVYTMGTRSSDSYLRFDKENPPFELHRTERGGEVTYHGPGQLVMYPILNLRQHKMDLHWYLRTLEEVVIRTLWSACCLRASRVDGLTGVWVGEAKVAAIGIRVSRWITYHGLALNVTTDLAPFQNIVPCGITDRQVGSIQQLLKDKHHEDQVNGSLTSKTTFSSPQGLGNGSYKTGVTSDMPKVAGKTVWDDATLLSHVHSTLLAEFAKVFQLQLVPPFRDSQETLSVLSCSQ